MQYDQERAFTYVPPICHLCGKPIFAGERVTKQDDGVHTDCLQRKLANAEADNYLKVH